jgi:uncharacterized protein with GYD domain
MSPPVNMTWLWSWKCPNGDAMTKLAVAITSSGNARTTTVRAFAPEEFGKLATEAPTMT